MTHLDEGVLRRMQDEPNTTSADDSAHFAACPHCQARAVEVRRAADGASLLLSVPEARVEPAVALLRMRRLAGDGGARGGGGWLSRVRRARAFGPAAAGVLALGLVVSLMATGLAEKAVQVFEPQHFAAVNVDPGNLSALPDLSQFGSYTVSSQPKFTPAKTRAEALVGSGMSALLAPKAPLPSSVKGTPSYEVFTVARGSFTFSADKARAYAASKGKKLPDMPRGVDGTTLSGSAGPGVLTIYGAPPGLVDASSSADGADPATPSDSPKKKHGLGGLSIPSLAIVQMTSPAVTSSGASVKELEDYIASIPGVPADVVAQVRAISDPTTTLPVPVPTGQGSHPVDIGDSKGLFVGDSTGLGAGVVWQSHGVLYAVVGTLSETQVLDIARGLS